jgi:hypothetical protein
MNFFFKSYEWLIMHFELTIATNTFYKNYELCVACIHSKV